MQYRNIANVSQYEGGIESPAEGEKKESQEQGQCQPALLAETAQDVFLSQCHFPSGYFALG